jgi:hypothetical protein
MSYRVRSHKFCCCIPVRFGTCISACLGIALGGLVVIAAALQFDTVGLDKLALGIQIGGYSLLALLSLFGLIGALIRNKGMVKAYWVGLICHLLFSLSSGAYFIYTLFKSSDDQVQQCLDAAKDDSTVTEVVCKGALAVLKGVSIGVLVIVLLLELWGCFIVRSYIWQLREEDDQEDTRKLKEGMAI